jgi:hypothetical protein
MVLTVLYVPSSELAIEGQRLVRVRVCNVCSPLSSKNGTYKTVKARLWHWLSGKRPYNLFSCSLH